ncbi:MAG: hypothetical protein AAGD14_03910 [Planctomycetota bacterium]
MERARLAFLRTDLLRVMRDSFLVGLLGIALGMAVALRFVLPAIADRVTGFDLTTYFPLFASYYVIGVGAMMMGAVGGFLLLDSREENVLSAMAVSPVPLRRYFTILGAVMATGAFVLSVLQASAIGVGLAPWPAVVGCAFAGALFAPFFAFLLAGVATNKVEAFAVMKIIGVCAAIPIGAWFVDESWQWLFAFYPPYLVCKAWWVASEGGAAWPLWLLASIPMTAIYVLATARHFARLGR